MNREEALGYVMPFGKYRGCKLWQVDKDYLRWCLRKLHPDKETANAIASIVGSQLEKEKYETQNG